MTPGNPGPMILKVRKPRVCGASVKSPHKVCATYGDVQPIENWISESRLVRVHRPRTRKRAMKLTVKGLGAGDEIRAVLVCDREESLRLVDAVLPDLEQRATHATPEALYTTLWLMLAAAADGQCRFRGIPMFEIFARLAQGKCQARDAESEDGQRNQRGGFLL